MIIDSFIFYNEIKLLKFRLEELNDFVDYFVIVESKKTFVGNEKKSYYLENKSIFDKFSEKIIHVEVDFDSNNPWVNERFQRDSIGLGLSKLNLSDDDLIIISDVDEIPDMETILTQSKSDLENGMVLVQDTYYYNLNIKVETSPIPIVIVPYKMVKSHNGVQAVVNIWSGLKPLEKGGWHFSFFGDIDFIVNKVKNYSHQEFNNDEFLNSEHIQYCIENGKDIFKRGKENSMMTYIDIKDNNYLPKKYKLLLDDVGTINEQIEIEKTNNYIYCTIAIGERYFNSACEFAKQLNNYSINHKVLIVTDQEFVEIDNCIIEKVPDNLTLFYPNGCFNYNLKHYPIKLCSDLSYDFVFYFDADWGIYEKYSEDKVKSFIESFNRLDLDFCFERPHFIGAKHEWDNCFWRHKIEPYKLMETTKYDNGHVCNEQFLAFKNNDKLKKFVDFWDSLDKFSVENNIWPFAEGLEIGMSSIEAEMNFSWTEFHHLNSCFMFYVNNSLDDCLIRF